MTVRVLVVAGALLGGSVLVRCAAWTPERTEVANECMRRCLTAQDPAARQEEEVSRTGVPMVRGPFGSSCEQRCSQTGTKSKSADEEYVPPDPFKPGPSSN